MPAVCLAPTSLAAARAARRLCDAQDGVLFGPDVTTLDRIVPLVLASAGDRRPVLPQLAERLVVAAAGREAGGPFADLSPDAGLAAALASSIAELRRAEVEPEDARVAAEGLSGAPAARLRALAGALEAYEARLRATGALDRAGATRAAASAARRGRTPWGAELDLLVVSGLTATSPGEWDLVASLAGLARRSRFHLPFFADRPDLCAPAEPLLRRVEGLHELAARRELEVVLGHADGDGRAALPSALLAALAGGRARAASGGGRVFALAGAGEEGEDDAAAKAVERLLEAGLGPEEIAVVAPSPRGAAPGLARACAARGIPFAAGRCGSSRRRSRPRPRRRGRRSSGSPRPRTSRRSGSTLPSRPSSTARGPSTAAPRPRRRSAAARRGSPPLRRPGSAPSSSARSRGSTGSPSSCGRSA